MKKLILFILIFALICASLAGCAAEKAEPESENIDEREPLVVCVDLGIGGMNFAVDETVDIVRGYMDDIQDYAKVGMFGRRIEIEVIPADDTARKAVIQRIHTEMMTGGGPDVFICSCPDPENPLDGEPLFQFPDIAMRRGSFMALDSYIENAQFMNMNCLETVIMEAGRLNGKQYILPTVFSFPITGFKIAEVDPYDYGTETTWYDVISGEDEALALSGWYAYTKETNPECGAYQNFLSFTWPELADYDREELLITEEDIRRRIEEAGALRKYSKSGAGDDLAHYHALPDRYIYDPINPAEPKRFGGVGADSMAAMLPLYNDKGGCTAIIRGYAAVSANTKHPDDAFFVVDFLLSRGSVKYSRVYKLLWKAAVIPTYTDYSNINGEGFMAMNPNAAVCMKQAMKSITNARFVTKLDQYIIDIAVRDARKKYGNAEERNRAIKKAYEEMQMLMGES